MAPNHLRRSFSSASAPAPSYPQHHSRPQGRPNTIPLNKEKLAKIRQKLEAYRAAVTRLLFDTGIDARDASNIVAQAVQGRAPRTGRGPSSSAQSISGHSEQSLATDVTNDTHDTGFTITTFNSRTGAEQQEKAKKQLNPVLKARKDLMRSIGTCNECRSKKVKCSLSHHALEDLLEDFPEAAGDIRWALEHDTDPRQADRNITSPLRNSPNGPAPLQTFAEEEVEDSGAQRQDVVGQVNDIFGVGNVGLSLYSQELDVEGMNDGNGYEVDFNAAENQSPIGIQVQTEFCRPIPVQQNYFGAAMHTQPFASSSSYPRYAAHQSFSMSPRRSSNANFTPTSTLSPSRSYQSSESALQSQMYNTNPQSPIYTPPEMQPARQSGDFVVSPIGADEVPVVTIEPSTSPATRRHDFRCMVGICGLAFPMLEQMRAHILERHSAYEIVSPDPVRRFCFACHSLCYKKSTSCQNPTCVNRQGMPGAQSPWLVICGKLVALSGFSLDDVDMTGMWDLTNAQTNGGFNFMGNGNDNTGYGHFNGFGGQQ